MKVKYFVTVILTVLISCSTSNMKMKPTSDVPERREFPINEKINPCDDFYQYACSEAIAGFKLREDRSSHSFSFSDSHERILNKKKDYLKNLLTQTKFNKRSQQLHDYYGSCMNTESRKKEEIEILERRITELRKVTNKKEFAKYLMTKALESEGGVVGYFNIANLDNSNKNDFMIMPSRMTSLPVMSYYENQELIYELKNIITDFFMIAGLEKEEAKKRATWIVDFEKKFITIYPTPAQRRPLWSKRSYSKKSDLRKYEYLNLAPLLNKVPSGIKIRNPMENVFSYINEQIETLPLENLKAIYLYQTTSSILDESHPNFFNRSFQFNNKFLGGSPKRTDLEERCASTTMSSFGKEIDAELFDKIFPNFSEKKFVATLEKVRGSIIRGLKNNKWLSAAGKKGAIDKMKYAKFQVVKPKTLNEWNFNPEAKYNPNKFYGNQLLLSKKLTDRSFKRLPRPVDKTIWYMGPLTVNAYYNGSTNTFVMPAGILQYPFYDPSSPEWVNLGAVGAVVGHELGHGVDDQGSKYDYKGRVRNWMPKADIVKFKKKGQRLVDQFNKAGHDGVLTLGENIGDLVGVTFALDAAKRVMPKETAMRDQATKDFFLQYARAWCGVMRPKMEIRRLKTDPHSLGWARVNEQMKHQPEFARVYQCSESDKLVIPAGERVKIW